MADHSEGTLGVHEDLKDGGLVFEILVGKVRKDLVIVGGHAFKNAL